MGKNLDFMVQSLIAETPRGRLVKFVSNAYGIEIDNAIEEIARNVHARLRQPHHQFKNDYLDALSLFLYQRFGHLIPKDIREEGIQIREESGRRPVNYDTNTGTVYS